MAIASPETTRIGFVGLGVMGKAMARNIRKAGYRLTVANRSRPAVDALVADGAVAAASPAELARASDVVMLCLPDTPDVEAVLFGPSGVAEGARPGLVVVDTSTISATATQGFAARLAEAGVTLIDSPVTGGPKGAVDGTLTCMLGGEVAAVEAVMPLLRAIGGKHVHLGPAGAGQFVKSCNQLVVATTLAGVCEALALARSGGLDLAAVREVLLGGSAKSFVMENHAKRAIDGTLAPGFRSSLMLKDLTLAVAAGRDNGVFMPSTTLVAQLFTALCNGEERELDSAALSRLVARLSGQD
jgi:2-hydroxy-3-oxopropionate reductase